MNDDDTLAAINRALYEPDSGATFLHRFMGLRMSITDEVGLVELDYQQHLANRQRRLHGGVIALLCDIGMGTLHRETLGSGLTLELKIQYLRAVQDGYLRCESQFLKKGRSISFMEARVRNQDEALVAVASATWALAG